jgi:hypothetical protein
MVSIRPIDSVAVSKKAAPTPTPSPTPTPTSTQTVDSVSTPPTNSKPVDNPFLVSTLQAKPAQNTNSEPLFTTSISLNTGLNMDTVTLSNPLFTGSLASSPIEVDPLSSSKLPPGLKATNLLSANTGSILSDQQPNGNKLTNLITSSIDLNTFTAPPGSKTLPIISSLQAIPGTKTSTATGDLSGNSDVLVIDAGDHMDLVTKTLKAYGPNANVVPHTDSNNTSIPFSEDYLKNGLTSKNLQSYLKNQSTDFLKTYQNEIKSAIEENPGIEVVNLSLNWSKTMMYEHTTMSVLSSKDPTLLQTLGIQDPDAFRRVQEKWFNEVSKITDPKDFKEVWTTFRTTNAAELQAFEPDIIKAVNDYTAGPEFNTALKDYQDFTTTYLKEKNIQLVVAYGNGNNISGYEFKGGAPDQEVGFLAMTHSPNVYSVTGVTDNSATGKPVMPFSQGGGGWSPTISADGYQVELPDGTIWSGTSASAPEVAATIAEMRNANPNLKNEDIRSIFQKTGFDVTPGTEADGEFGILNQEQAIALAKTGSPPPSEIELTDEQSRFLRPISRNFRKVALSDDDISSITEKDLQIVAASQPDRPALVWAADTLLKDTQLLQQLNMLDGNAANGFTYEELLKLLGLST